VFDRTTSARDQGLQALTGAAATASDGKLLQRFVNAGLRMHVPSVVNRYDAVAVGRQPAAGHCPQARPKSSWRRQDLRCDDPAGADDGSYHRRTYALVRPAAELSTNNGRDGGMQG